MKRIVAAGASLVLALTVVAVGPTSAASANGPWHPPHADEHFYTTKTTYAPRESLRDYQQAPRGFVPIFTESVARHGSRAMTDGDDGDAVLAVLGSAQAQGALTGLGARLAPQVQTLLAGATSIGYGNLSGRGAQEQQQTALRMERRLPSLFASIVAGQEPVEVVTSGQARAVASANAFTGGLVSGDPALAGLIQVPVTNKDLPYFHKQPQNADYQDYLANDPDLAAVLAEIDGKPATAAAARHVVSRLFRANFVAAMATDAQISLARSLFELYSAAPDLWVEAQGVDLDDFLPASDARWFAYLDDAEEFYQSGPAFSGRTITYGMAGVLLDDLFAQARARAAGTSGKGAVLWFTHAEEVEPLAVLLGLPGSTKAASLGDPYTYQNNPWRGADVAPMAANVQWDLFAGPASTRNNGSRDNGSRYLVRMSTTRRRRPSRPPAARLPGAATSTTSTSSSAATVAAEREVGRWRWHCGGYGSATGPGWPVVTARTARPSSSTRG